MALGIKVHMAPGDEETERGRELAQILLGAASASTADGNAATFEQAVAQAVEESAKELIGRHDGTMLASLVVHLVRLARILLEGWSKEMGRMEGMEPGAVEARILQSLAVAVEREASTKAEEFNAFRRWNED
jgi:hypothetical protein